jgi:hypothetical protein
LQRVSRQLALYVGPIADIFVNRAASGCTSTKALYLKVAEEINSAAETREIPFTVCVEPADSRIRFRLKTSSAQERSRNSWSAGGRRSERSAVKDRPNGNGDAEDVAAAGHKGDANHNGEPDDNHEHKIKPAKVFASPGWSSHRAAAGDRCRCW